MPELSETIETDFLGFVEDLEINWDPLETTGFLNFFQGYREYFNDVDFFFEELVRDFSIGHGSSIEDPLERALVSTNVGGYAFFVMYMKKTLWLSNAIITLANQKNPAAIGSLLRSIHENCCLMCEVVNHAAELRNGVENSLSQNQKQSAIEKLENFQKKLNNLAIQTKHRKVGHDALDKSDDFVRYLQQRRAILMEVLESQYIRPHFDKNLANELRCLDAATDDQYSLSREFYSGLCNFVHPNAGASQMVGWSGDLGGFQFSRWQHDEMSIEANVLFLVLLEVHSKISLSFMHRFLEKLAEIEVTTLRLVPIDRNNQLAEKARDLFRNHGYYKVVTLLHACGKTDELQKNGGLIFNEMMGRESVSISSLAHVIATFGMMASHPELDFLDLNRIYNQRLGVTWG